VERFDIGEVLARAPLSEVARRLGIEIERKGSRLTALCPFHQDTRPSLSFFPGDYASPEHFHCFACGAHGHAIDLVKQVQGVDFLAAVQWLAQSFGIRSARRQPTGQADRGGSTEGAMAFALRVFDECHDAPRFQAWCEERAFEADFLYCQGLRCISHAVLLPALESKETGERVELIDGLLSLGLIRQLRTYP
jgi:DNA primase